MAGKIDQYEVGSFSPSAVGTPGQDKSGQILATGVEAISKALMVREDTSNTLSAMNKFGEFQLQHEQNKLKLQQQYQADPTEYATAVKTMSDKLSDDMSKGMPSGVFQKFKNLTTSATAQDADNNVKWAFARDNEIQIGKITSIKQNIALKASTATSAEGLANIIGRMDPVTGGYTGGDFAAVSAEATKFITPEADKKLTDEHRKLAIEFNLDAQLMSRPLSLKADLEGGAYKGVINPDIIKSYSDKARNALINRAIDDQYRTLFLAQGKILDFKNGLDDGSKTIVDVIAEREAANANRGKKDINGDPVVSPGYIQNLDTLIAGATQSTLRTPKGKEANKAALDTFDRQWEGYLLGKKDAHETPSPKDLEKELEVFASLRQNYLSGAISKNQYDEKFNLMETRHKLDKKNIAGATPFNQAIDQAGVVESWWGMVHGPGKDVVSQGYQMIKDHVDKAYPELPETDRRDLKAQMLSQYHQAIKATPEDFLNAPKTDNERRAFAQRLVYGGVNAKGEQMPGIIRANSSFSDGVSAKRFQVGETVPEMGVPRVYLGNDPSTGKPKFELAPGILNSIQTIRGHKIKITGLDSEGHILKTDVKNE